MIALMPAALPLRHARTAASAGKCVVDHQTDMCIASRAFGVAGSVDTAAIAVDSMETDAQITVRSCTQAGGDDSPSRRKR